MTIHNINESKFLANQSAMPISNHVEITRIPVDKSKQNCDKLAVGSERKSLQQTTIAGGAGVGAENHNVGVNGSE